MYQAKTPEEVLATANVVDRSDFESNAYGAKYHPQSVQRANDAQGFPWTMTDPRGGCVFNHRVFPVGSHQCMGPGVSPGPDQPNLLRYEGLGDNSDVGDDGGDSGSGDGGGD